MLIRSRPLVALLAVCAALAAGACSKAQDTSASNAPAGFALTNDPVQAASNAGIRMLSQEGTKVHYHPHLDINVNGQTITVPANIGISSNSISELHTHDTSGTIHIEADQAAQFTLGQLFTEWGVKFDGNCLGPVCSDATNELRVYENGKQVSDPTKLVLKDGQEIYVWYGPRSTQPSVPASIAPAPVPQK